MGILLPLIGLPIRMALYAVFAGLAGYSIGEFSDAGVYSISVDQLLELALYAIGYAATFLMSRYAKMRGRRT